MSKFWALSSTPDSPSSSSGQSPEQAYDDSALEGVAANVKLLLKLIQDHKDACKKEKKDGRRMLRVATMMTILDNVRTRIQKCQSFGTKKPDVVLSEVPPRRSYTDIRSGMRRCHQEAAGGDDENARLRRELNASTAARKSMEIMCSSLGKEKEIMAAELSRKAHELNGMEELINDLKAQNRTLLEKAHERASEQKEQDKSSNSSKGSSSEEDMQRNMALHERNKTLSEQVQIALDGYRSMKSRLKEAQEENAAMRATMEEMGAKVSASLDRIRGFKEKFSTEEEGEEEGNIQREIAELEHMFECFEMQVSKHGGGGVKGGCVRVDFTDVSEPEDWIWGTNGLNVYSSRPKNRGTKDSGVSTGTFLAGDSVPSCLKNLNTPNPSSMPNLPQIKSLLQTYSPWIYFHPDEEFLPSSVPWFFKNGALLYTKGQESSPAPIEQTGANLPQGGNSDGAYWLDLPTNDGDKDRVKKGNLQDCTCYAHVKPMLGATFTDIALWMFYPFNGPARAKVEFLTIKLGKIGEHVGDWEHVTLRISNFNGELKRVYFSEHSRGMWVSASQVEFQNGNKPVVYSSLHGHAAYPAPGLVLQGSKVIGIRNDTEKGNMVMDTGASFSIVSAEYLGSEVTEPPWLNYAREWGPKINYDIAKELKKVERFMPGKLKAELEKVVRSLPNEVLGEEGPTGPKWKDSWSGDERS